MSPVKFLINKHAKTKTKNNNVRVFFPVGMGGFSFERMDETTVVYDCGSTSKKVIDNSIIDLKEFFFGDNKPVIDHLFISHFDSDHCNGVEKLLSVFDVKEIHLPYIDYKYRAVLNFMTKGGVLDMFRMLVQKAGNSMISFYQTNKSTAYSIRSTNEKWEWVITNLLNEEYFDTALTKVKESGITFEERNEDSLEELVIVGGEKIEEARPNVDDYPDDAPIPEGGLAIYAQPEENRLQERPIQLIEKALSSLNAMTISDKLKDANRKIPDIVKDIEKNAGYAKNEYGMLMLSKRIADARTIALFFKNQVISWWHHYNYYYLTSCLYTGDMCMNKDADMGVLLSLIAYNREKLQFFQIPHHGSAHNSSLDRLNRIKAQLFFCYDNNSRRLVNYLGKVFPFRNSQFLNILLIDRESEMDEALSIT